jgi:drug/metabolite transporter (DMT)-like permease
MSAVEASAQDITTSRVEASSTVREWTNLWIVYIVWGSTYLAIALMVETMPPLLSAGARFTIVGLLVLPFVALRRGVAAIRPTRANLLSAGFVGLMLPGANAVLSVAEKTVPSGLAALLVGSIPLWVMVLRMLAGERLTARSVGALLLGFAGLALVVKPSGGASIAGPLVCVGAALMWATGSFASPRIQLPKDSLVSIGYQSLLGGLVIIAAGAIGGELGDFHPSAWSLRSILGLVYLITFGSLLAYTAYTWLLQNVPIGKVSTYAYVNPVVAIVLGWLINGESISISMIVGAAIIVASVALVIRVESR